MRTQALISVVCALLVVGCESVIAPQTISFGVSQFQLQLKKTYTLYEYEGAATQTYFWLTGTYNDDPWKGRDSAGDMIFSVYIDDDKTPTYQFTPFQLIGVGFSDKTAPWGNELFGRASAQGGIYSHMRIPFQKSIRYDVELPPSADVGSILFWQVRLTKNVGITVGGTLLPPNAKLVQYRYVDVLLQKLEFITLVNTKNSGAVFMHFHQGNSTSANWMEGCYRAYYANSTTASLLSTGYEDYYQSAYYFSAGPYRFAGSGNTHASGASISAYKVHDSDPFFFPSGGFKFVWRNGDTQSAAGLKCADDNGHVVLDPKETTVTTYTWVYEW